MNSKTMLLLMAITILFVSGCQNDSDSVSQRGPVGNTIVSNSPVSTTGATSAEPSAPEAVIGEPVVVGSPETVETVAVKTPLPEPSVTVMQGQSPPPVEDSTPVMATETSTAATLPASASTAEPTPTLQSITTPATSAAANSASPTPVLCPTTTWKPPQITAADVPDDWLTYVDEEAGYSFKYPSEFHLSAGTNKGDKFKHVFVEFLPSKKFRPWMAVTIEENINNIPIEQYLIKKYIDLTKQPNPPAEYLAAMEKITINGLPSIWSKADGVSEVFIVIDAYGKIFKFSISNGIIVDDLRVVDDASKDTFYQIVNTFTLLPK